MKKYVFIILVLLCICLYSCSTPAKPPNKNQNENPTDTISATDSTTIQEYPNSPPPEYIYPLDYSSLSDFDVALRAGGGKGIYSGLDENIETSKRDDFEGFVSKLQSQKIPVPCLNEKAVNFREKEGFPNISLFISEAYDLPWIYFYPEVSSGENFYIKITFLPDNILAAQKKPTASDVIYMLSPNSPNINNLGERHKNIYNTKIQLQDCEVVALIYEYKTDNRNSTMFVYGNMLVEVRSSPDVWSTQWFSTLSFGYFDS